jgi:hypothetical protein
LNASATDVLFDYRMLGDESHFAWISCKKGRTLPVDHFAGGRMIVRIRPLVRRTTSELCANNADDA